MTADVTEERPLRIGVLGAAAIVRGALIEPAKRVGVDVAAIAARDPQRASKMAARFGIPTVHEGYRSLLEDDSLDAIYIPLPASLHGAWTIEALRAGKHVLVEKPFTANADEARAVANAATGTGLTVMEAHHTSHHPLIEQIRRILDSGELGQVSDARATFYAPLAPGKDIRWNEDLGGGGLMDLGCYPVRMLLDLFGRSPTVTSATARARGQIDRTMTASLDFGGGRIGVVDVSMWSRKLLGSRLTVRGDRATLEVAFPYHPHTRGSIRVVGELSRRTEKVSKRYTYDFQLEAFVAATRGGPNITGPDEAIATMTVIDECYRLAGLRPRWPYPATSPA